MIKPDAARFNLILTGFMGTGKSTVGRLVAERLDRPFIDMDCVLEQRAGQTIPVIFATQGEAAFRQMERNLCQELAIRQGLVIATGGGTLVDMDNQAQLLASGIAICLDASPEVLLDRLRVTDRPLLQSPNPEARIQELLASRAAAYAALPHHIDTTPLTPEETAEAIIQLWLSRFP